MSAEFSQARVVVEDAPLCVNPRKRFLPRLSRPWFVLGGNLALLIAAAVYHYAIYLPQPDRPHRLTALDDVFAGYVALAAALAGLALGRRMLRPFALVDFSRLERGALALGLGWGLLGLGVFALGMAHLFYLWAILALLTLVLLVGWPDVWRLVTMLALPGWYRSLHSFQPRGFFGWSLSFFTVIELILLGFQWLNPSPALAIDLYQYHWAVPKLYLLHHAMYALPGWAHANFPFQMEMLNTIALAFNAPVAALLIQGSYGVLVVVLLAGYLYRSLGAQAAWLGAALCLCSPLLTSLLSVGYVEPALAYYIVASIVLALNWREQRQKDGEGTLRLLLLAGLYAGVGLAAKYTQAQVILGVGMWLLGMGVWQALRARRQQRSYWPALRDTLKGLCLYGTGALVPLLPWLLKDWVLLGNPVYPFVWGGPEWDSARTQVGIVTFAHFGPQGPLWQVLLFAFWGSFFETGRSGEPFVIPMNYLLLCALAAPLLLLLDRFRRSRSNQPAQARRASPLDGGALASWLLVAGGAYVVWALSHALVERYAMAWLILLIAPSVTAQVCFCRWLSRWPLARVLMQGLIVCLLLALGPLLSLHFVVNSNPLPLLVGKVSLHQWQGEHAMDQGYRGMLGYVEAHVPQDARLLLVGRGVGYFLDGYDYVADSGEDWIPYLETEGKTPAGILKILQQDGFRYLIYEETTLQFVTQIYGNTYLASFLPQFRQFLNGSLQQVWSYRNFHIYQISS